MYILEKSTNKIIIKDYLNTNREVFNSNSEKSEKYEIYGIYGIVEFNESEYLIVIRDANKVGTLNKKPVYMIKSVKIFTIKGNKDYNVINTIYDFFKIPGIYFSEFEIFKRYISFLKSSEDGIDFIFNKYPLSIYKKNHKHFIVKCIQGYFGKWNNLCLISRRLPDRAGARYFSRGCDNNGKCSNFVETEQIIENESAYIHLRGSIPLKWKHIMSWKYMPKISLNDKNEKINNSEINNIKKENCDQKEKYSDFSITNMFNFRDKSVNDLSDTLINIQKKIFIKSTEYLKTRYNQQIIYLNLINETGYEGKIYNLYKTILVNETSYHLNFHKSLDKEHVALKLSKICGYTTKDKIQTVIIRTNCIDCLDRTNSMQYLIGHNVLFDQLCDYFKKLKLKDNSTIYLEKLKIMFLENGNNLSIQYAGTPALLHNNIYKNKNAVITRIDDFLYSLKRYWINRTQHGNLQNSYNILCGIKNNGTIRNYQKTLNNALFILWGIFLILSISKKRKFYENFIYLIILFFLGLSLSSSFINFPIEY